MESHSGIVITGTEASGKSTIAARLSKSRINFRQLPTVTTRSPRPDDNPPLFEYVSEQMFGEFEASGQLITKASYRGKRYGVLLKDLVAVTNSSGIPLVIMNPEATCRFLVDRKIAQDPLRYMSVFLDDEDSVLDARINSRMGARDPDTNNRRR